MIGVIDIGLGNTRSVFKALSALECDYKPICDNLDFDGVSKVIFPGVGTFASAMEKMHSRNLIKPLMGFIESDRPYLGICLGMQLLTECGFEIDETPGLGVVKGRVAKIDTGADLKLPHIGWNEVEHDGAGIFADIANPCDFYFVHSYCVYPDEEMQCFFTKYPGEVVAYLRKSNMHGVQFHPEKSQKGGLQLLRNFLEKC